MAISDLQRLPHNIELRHYQLDVWKAYRKGIKRFINVWHRRAGKDKCWFNLMLLATQQVVGNYIYCLPEIRHAKKVIWDAIDARTGLKFIDHIPANLIDKVNHSDLMIRFKNGSTLQLLGADNYDSLVGANPIGIVISEYALCHPLCWQYLQPILVENGGWIAFVFTPRGNNHAAELYEKNKNNAEWYVNKLTIDDTNTLDGLPCITREDVQKLANNGNMSRQLINQEFYCSFAAALSGAYWADAMDDLVDTGRIRNFAIDFSVPVSTYWDLGWGDATAIWWVQCMPDGTYNLVKYYENRSQRIDHYVRIIQDFGAEFHLLYDMHYLPHDSRKHNLQTGQTDADYVRGFRLPVTELPRPTDKRDSIHAVRVILPDCRIHQTHCAVGIECLKSYQASHNDRHSVYGAPLHNWASHGADAVQYFAAHAIAQKFSDTHCRPMTVIDHAVNCDDI